MNPESDSPLIKNYKVHYAEAAYDQLEIDAVLDVLRNSPKSLMAGDRVRNFESRVASLFGKTHGLMVNSGSSANTIAVACLDLKPGDEVITPALTFSTTVSPLVQQGLVPCFVDVEPCTFNIDADRIEAMVSASTRAMMIPNLLGNMPDWIKLRALADRHNLLVIEDSADTIGSMIHGVNTGMMSDIVTTSFYASHVITAAGFGGMMCCNREDMQHQAALLRGWGRNSSVFNESDRVEDRFRGRLDGLEYDGKFLFEAMGYNFMPSEIGAAFGLVQLDKLSGYTQTRIQNWSSLREYFGQFEQFFKLPVQRPGHTTPWLAFPLIVRDGLPFNRTELQMHFEQFDIQTRPIFTGNILKQKGFQNISRREDPAGYPNADQVTRGGIMLGCHQRMGDSEISYIAEVFEKFVSSRGLNS